MHYMQMEASENCPCLTCKLTEKAHMASGNGRIPAAGSSPTPLHMQPAEQQKQWFVLRDFKKWNAKSPGYKELPRLGIQCFTPMHWIVTTRRDVRKREYVPVIQNLLFAFDSRAILDPVIERESTLQYQFRRGAGSGVPMTVDEQEMERFISAVGNDPAPVYYSPDELTEDMIGKEVVVTGGPLDGYRGRLLKLRGTKKRRVIIEIRGFIAAAVEVNPAFIQLV